MQQFTKHSWTSQSFSFYIFWYSYTSLNVNHKKLFLASASGVISYVVFIFRRLAISAAQFSVVFIHFEICKICRSSTTYRDLIKENIITKRWKLYSSPRNLRTGNSTNGSKQSDLVVFLAVSLETSKLGISILRYKGPTEIFLTRHT